MTQLYDGLAGLPEDEVLDFGMPVVGREPTRRWF
jgi:hypothetical protein